MNNPMLRKGLYVFVMAAGIAAVTFGVLDQSQADQWVAIIMGILGVVGGGTAIGNITPRPDVVTAAQVEGLVRDAIAGIGDRLAETPAAVAKTVDEARRDLEDRLSRRVS